MQILTSEQMKSIDRRASARFGIPSIVLMENAALGVVEAIAARFPACQRAAIFCGTGANGGDGFAAARHLEQRGIVPIVFVVGDRAKISGDAATNLRACQSLSLPIYDVTDGESLNDALLHASDADLIVDALFGTGLNRAPSGIHAEAIEVMNDLALPVVAVDLPSGLDASSGTPFEPSVRADVTVTFAALKVCHVFGPAALQCGDVIVRDIGIPLAAVEDENVTLHLTSRDDVLPFFARRRAVTHKGTYGHVAIVAGSPGRSGAAVLAARGAIRAGAGLVSVATDAETAKLVHIGSIESMTYSGDDVAGFVAARDAALIGPGLADDEASYSRVRDLVEAIEVPLVVDASALNAFAGRAGELNRHRRPRIITPHPGELARLLGTTAAGINARRVEVAREAARITNCIVVLKGFQTLVADPSGRVNVNPTGNPGMASGGMGDVLGGIAAALLARRADPFDAAVAAVYLHGFSGDMLRDESCDTGLAALDLAEHLPLAIKRLRG